jgi:hypothetical protein
MLSAALVLCGEKPLNSLTDPRYGAQVGAALFDMVYENELTANRWRFNSTKGTLSRLNSTPINEWQYAYQIPTDCLNVIGIWGVSPDNAYEIYGTTLCTNLTNSPGSSSLVLEYQFKPDPATLPSSFTLLVTLALAMHMCKPVKESDSARTKCEQAYGRQRNVAMSSDAQSRPNRPLQSRPFISAR